MSQSTQPLYIETVLRELNDVKNKEVLDEFFRIVKELVDPSIDSLSANILKFKGVYDARSLSHPVGTLRSEWKKELGDFFEKFKEVSKIINKVDHELTDFLKSFSEFKSDQRQNEIDQLYEHFKEKLLYPVEKMQEVIDCILAESTAKNLTEKWNHIQNLRNLNNKESYLNALNNKAIPYLEKDLGEMTQSLRASTIGSIDTIFIKGNHTEKKPRSGYVYKGRDTDGKNKTVKIYKHKEYPYWVAVVGDEGDQVKYIGQLNAHFFPIGGTKEDFIYKEQEDRTTPTSIQGNVLAYSSSIFPYKKRKRLKEGDSSEGNQGPPKRRKIFSHYCKVLPNGSCRV